MKMLKWWLVGALFVCLVGCEKYVVSLMPLCPDESSVAVPGLEGKWACEGQVWTIRVKEDTSYEMRVADAMDTARFDGRCRRLGDHLYVELRPISESEASPVPSLYDAHWVQACSFMQVQLQGDVLRLKRLNAETLKGTLEEKPGLIKHVFQGDNVVLVDETEPLARFVQAQADVNELWQEQGEFVRCQPLYRIEDLIQGRDLMGQWQDPNDKEHGHIEVTSEGNHIAIQFSNDSDENLIFSGHLFKLQGLRFKGVFLGPEEIRAREMATLMPDWFALVTLKEDRLDLNVLDYMTIKELLAHPEQVQEDLSKPDVEMIRVRP
ncbi:MAG: hypothetical protein K9N55_08765 [Phycisphaerae bacterium]|nr:hypothetical protein [Phycisphaerae bacterium]